MNTAFPNKLPANCLIQFPAGTWGFVGSVDAALAYVDAKTGDTPTDEQMSNARQFGPRLAGVTSRSWPTREAAVAAAAALGCEVAE